MKRIHQNRLQRTQVQRAHDNGVILIAHYKLFQAYIWLNCIRKTRHALA